MGKRKVRIGRVVSDRMDKTVVVAVETSMSHPLYKKTVRKVKKYKSHDENNVCRIGDKVKVVETRPLSKEKRWRVAEILSKGCSTTSTEVMGLSHDKSHKTTDAANNITVREDDSELYQAQDSG